MRVEIALIQCKKCGNKFIPRVEYVYCSKCRTHRDDNLILVKGRELEPVTSKPINV